MAVHLPDWSKIAAKVGDKPMDGAFHPDGKRFLAANKSDATLSEIFLPTGLTVCPVPAGKGSETLAFF